MAESQSEDVFDLADRLKDVDEGTEIVVTVLDDYSADPEEVEVEGTVVGRESCRGEEFMLRLDTDRGRRFLSGRPEPGFVEEFGPASTWGFELLSPAGDEWPDYKYKSEEAGVRDISIRNDD